MLPSQQALPLVIADHGHEIIKEVTAVVRARCALRMVLHGELRLAFYTDALDGLVVEVNVGYFYMTGIFYRFRLYTKTVVLCGDLATAGDQVFYRVVHPPVPVMHLKSWNIIGSCQELVSQADPESGLIFLEDFFHCLYRVIHRSRVAGTIRNKIS